MKSVWQPGAAISILQQRAQLLSNIRAFFNSRNYLEVETPVLGKYGVTDVYLSNIAATIQQQTYWLQTSPEYHMKRLLAAGSGPIYQIARAFREDELGSWHNPEFTLLEWYKLDANHHELMAEVDAFLQQLLSCPPMQFKTYRHVFLEYCGIDPFYTDVPALRQVLKQFQLQQTLPDDEEDRDQYLFLLLSHVIEPQLATSEAPIAIYDFPPSQAALAQIHNGVAERFEIYYRGLELANGFHELQDTDIQRRRFAADNNCRRQKGLPEKAVDPNFLQALQHGLPPCSGVALGVDRLVALALEKASISEVIAFDFNRA